MSYPPFRSSRSREPLHRRNGKIRAREVRVIDERKEQRGVMSLNEALALARQKGLDLVEIAPTATPPVCRIVDYGKFLYEESKRAKDSKQTTGKMKELQISPAIDPHDLGVKLNHAIGFLCEDMKVRIKMRFRGRQNAHKDIGFALMNQFVKDLAAYALPDTPPKMMGERDLTVLLSPLPRNKRAKAPDQVEASPETPE
ncbi:MAG TPA: translation initiation factor IF-3 [Candidatus Paceibacterota bacterium]|nr:translation initiation factor IF-3 [Candidatus Paceibacterota bacterium]